MSWNNLNNVILGLVLDAQNVFQRLTLIALHLMILPQAAYMHLHHLFVETIFDRQENNVTMGIRLDALIAQ